MIWIDIDNPPQVQYLVPIYRECRARGLEAFITARDNAITLQLLADQGVPHHAVGHALGRKKLEKVLGTLRRAVSLYFYVRRSRPRCLIAAGRASAIAARVLRIPIFIICDYEHAEIGLYARLGAHVLAPESIAKDAFLRAGFPERRIHHFRGLKEGLTFNNLDTTSYPPHPVPDPGKVVVAYRPPAVETHYYSSTSGDLSSALLRWLAANARLHVILLPRYPWQGEEAKAIHWSASYEIPARPIHFVSLLKAADLVISSGGTMLREAAVLQVPAYSIFCSSIGGVDRNLEATGRLAFIQTPEAFDRIRLVKRNATGQTHLDSTTMEDVIATIMPLI